MTGVIKCSSIDWFLFALLIAIAIALTAIGVIIIKRSIEEREAAKIPAIPGSLELKPKKIIKLLFFAFISAFFSAGLGVDLGLILAPALLHVGMDPVKALESETYMASFSALAATILVIVLNEIDYGYAINILVLGIIGATAGIFFQRYI